MKKFAVEEEVFEEMARQVSEIHEVLIKQPESAEVKRQIDAYIPFEEARRILRCCPSTLYHWKCAHKIPFIKAGGKLMFKASDIQVFLESGYKDAPEEKTVFDNRKF